MPINTNNTKQTILVIGGAGFIGSHMVLALIATNYDVVVLDNLSTGHRDAVLGAKLIVGDMADRDLLTNLFAEHAITAVMHFASYIEVAESVRLPLRYYQNNVSATLTLLEVMLAHGVRQFIFSSTAAVYGEPEYTPIDEAHPLAPINPYGRSKRMVEEIIQDLSRSDGLRYAILRYFNAAGADPEGRLGECHEPESHLIPLVLQVASGRREHLTVYGRDYATPDGSCVRDYVHVMDICAAHLLALTALSRVENNLIYNLGTGHGYSVQEVIAAARRVTGHPIPLIEAAKRAGDPAVLVADARAAQRDLHWRPNQSILDAILRDAWRFVQKHQCFT